MGVRLWLVSCVIAACQGGDPTRGPHHPRGHYRPHRPPPGLEGHEPPKLTQDNSLVHDTQHIREDLGDWVSEEATQKMTPEELEFHYFKLHDFDNNTKLDGLEILQAIHHTMNHATDDHAPPVDATGDHGDATGDHVDATGDHGDFEYFVELIDRVLAEDDADHDGFLSYVEYVVGRKNDEHRQQAGAFPTKHS